MWNRRQVVLGGTLSCLLPTSGIAARKAGGRKLITIFADGAWDVSYCLDPKIGLSTVDGPEKDENASNPDDREQIRTFSNIPIAVNRFKRPEVALFFEQWSSRCAVVNGISVGSIAHADANLRMLTGSRSSANPDLGAINGYSHGLATAIPYMDIGGHALMGPLAAYSGRTGFRNQLLMVLDRHRSYQSPDYISQSYPLFVAPDEHLDTVREFLQTRAQRHSELVGSAGRNAARLGDWFESHDRMIDILRQREKLAESIEFGTQQGLANQVELAVEMLRGQLCHSVCLNSGMGWDSHDDISEQHELYNELFAGLNNLMLALKNAALLDETVIVVVSEFTRTPKLNGEGGKDHWPVASALIIGDGLGGKVLGGTDDNLDAQPIDHATGELWSGGTPLRYDELFAGILQYLDIDPAEWLPNTTPYSGLL